jgi:hypothetical protein
MLIVIAHIPRWIATCWIHNPNHVSVASGSRPLIDNALAIVSNPRYSSLWNGDGCAATRCNERAASRYCGRCTPCGAAQDPRDPACWNN